LRAYPEPASRVTPRTPCGANTRARARAHMAHHSAARALYGRDDSGRGRRWEDVGLHVSVRRPTPALARTRFWAESGRPRLRSEGRLLSSGPHCARPARRISTRRNRASHSRCCPSRISSKPGTC
jgi:hypothetical protein